MIILHGDAQGRQDFARAAHWRRGFILAPPGSGLARIEYNGSDRRDATRCVGFDIQVASHQPRELWVVFAEALEHVIQDLERHYGYTSIVVKRLVSCPRSHCDREAARRFYFEESVIANRAQSGREGWREQTTICNADGCGKDLPLGLLWDGRASEAPGSLGRIETKIDGLAKCAADLTDEVRATHREVTHSERILQGLQADFTDIHHRLAANALASPEAVARILNGQAQLAQALRQDMERFSEKVSSRLREFHQTLADPKNDLPRFYTLVPVNAWKFPLFRKRMWRLRLHCEKTGYPAVLFSNKEDKQGEFIIPESQEFLQKVAPFVKRVSTALVALGPVTALLTTANPVIAVTPAIVLALADWAKAYQAPVPHLASMLEEEVARGQKGMVDTGTLPIYAEREGLLWLQNFLQKDPAHLSKLGLCRKLDGQGRVWWVLPNVEV
jgi:hypothetical protein